MTKKRKNERPPNIKSVIYRIYMALDMDSRKEFRDELEIAESTMRRTVAETDHLKRPFLKAAAQFFALKFGLHYTEENLKKIVNAKQFHEIIKSTPSASIQN